MNRIKFGVICFLFLLPCLSFAQQTINFTGKFQVIGDQLETLTDTNSNITLSEAEKATGFKKTVSQFPNLGTTKYSFWVRFKIKNNTDARFLGLQITQAMIDYVDFNQLKDGKVIQSNLSGHRLPFHNRIINHQTYIYPLNVLPRDTTTVYIHIRSGKQLILPIYAGTFQQVFENALLKDITFGIYVGIILVMILYNLFVYTTVRDKNYLYYILYLVVVLIAQASMEGYLFRFILPDYPLIADMLIYITTAMIGLAAIEFCKSFLQSKQYVPTLHKISYLFWLLYSVQMLLAFLHKFNISYTIMLASAMTSALYVLFMAIATLLRGSRSAKFFLIAWFVFIMCVVIYVLKDFNLLIPYNGLTSSALLIGSAFEAILLSFALADKINIFKAEKERSQEEALQALKENERIIREQNVVLESKVKERTAALSESNTVLNKTLDDLKQAQSQLVESEKMASLGQLTAGIAHEINNPINFVSSNINPLKRDIDMLLDAMNVIEEVSGSDLPLTEKQQKIDSYKEELDFDYLKEEIKHLIKGIKEGATRTAEIVKGLKIFSRLDEDDLKRADINEGLESTMVIANNLIGNNVEVEKNYGNLPLIECYAGKLNQVFLNIISNAVYAIKKQFGETAGGKLTLNTYFDDEKVYIKIRDNGIGMDEQTQRKIFEPFFTTKDVGEGTGLGMSIAYNTIKKHDGHIVIKSKPGEGTEFTLEIPIKFDPKLT